MPPPAALNSASRASSTSLAVPNDWCFCQMMLDTVAWIRPNPCVFFLLQMAFAAVYAAILVVDALAPGGDGFTNKSHVGGIVFRTYPHITSQMSRILMVDWMWLSHNPQFGPLSVGILHLLMSIVNFL